MVGETSGGTTGDSVDKFADVGDPIGSKEVGGIDSDAIVGAYVVGRAGDSVLVETLGGMTGESVNELADVGESVLGPLLLDAALGASVGPLDSKERLGVLVSNGWIVRAVAVG